MYEVCEVKFHHSAAARNESALGKSDIRKQTANISKHHVQLPQALRWQKMKSPDQQILNHSMLRREKQQMRAAKNKHESIVKIKIDIKGGKTDSLFPMSLML